ncbi:MAG: type II toxin-antitoxin system VapC family toxin [Acidobacteriota bacterium]
MVDFLLEPERFPRIGIELVANSATLRAPHLIDLEVVHALRGMVMRHRLLPGRAAAAISDFLAVPIERYPHEPLLFRAWELRDNLSAYDASYVALAEFLDVPLLTRDARLARSSGHTARIEYID